MPQGAPRHASGRVGPGPSRDPPTTWSLLVPVVALLAGALFATSSTAAAGGSLLRQRLDRGPHPAQHGRQRRQPSNSAPSRRRSTPDQVVLDGQHGRGAPQGQADALASYAGRTGSPVLPSG